MQQITAKEFEDKWNKIFRGECPQCHRLVLIDESGFITKHREDPPSAVICYMSGTYYQGESK